LGAAFIGFGVIAWLARKSEKSEARRAIVVGFVISFVIGFILSLISRLSGVGNELGWSTVGIYFLLALGYAYFEFVKKSSS